VRAPDLDALEHFFTSRGSAAHVELCPLADASVIREMAGRGYRVMDFSNMMVREDPGRRVDRASRVQHQRAVQRC